MKLRIKLEDKKGIVIPIVMLLVDLQHLVPMAKQRRERDKKNYVMEWKITATPHWNGYRKTALKLTLSAEVEVTELTQKNDIERMILNKKGGKE